jgi:1-acyl-sn-glycerol-3-phosphate acyltransferase
LFRSTTSDLWAIFAGGPARSIVNFIKLFIARLTIKIARYRLVGEPPPDVPVTVLVAAPHTSNWDFFLMLSMAWSSGLSPVWLGKQELFKGPMGWLMRKLGGIAVDRKNPHGLVERLVTDTASSQHYCLVVPAEGTRSKGDYWKTGFYRIAREANVPITLSFLDGPSRTGGFGPSFTPTGNVRADMDLIRAFYADKGGVVPANKTEPRLRDEPESDDETVDRSAS